MAGLVGSRSGGGVALLLQPRIQIQIAGWGGGGGGGGGTGSSKATQSNWGRRNIGCGWGIHGLLNGGLDSRAGEASLAHYPANAGVIEYGDDELLKLDLDSEKRLLLLLRAAAALVRLGALKSGHESIGDGGFKAWGDVLGGWEALKCDAEAELKSSALEWVGRIGV